MSADLCACKRILENEGLAESRRYGLVTDLFLGEGKTAFDFITDHVKAHGVEPTLATVKADTGIDLDVLAPEPLSYYAKKLFDRKVLTITQDHTKTIISHIQNRNADDAVDQARQIISDNLKWQFGKKTYVDPRLTIDARVKEQLRLETLHGTIDGYKTPWPELDKITRGMHGGEIWVLIAAKKTGKSFGEILFMKELVKQNLRPLFVTMEMSSDKIIRRFDAMYSTLAFGEFKSGLLGFDGIERYIDEMKRLAQEGEFFIAGDGLVRCPADIEILVQDLNPGVVLIDGVYLLEPSGRKWGSKYEKVSTVVDEIQPMAHRINRPIMMTTQFNRNLKEGSLTGDSGKVGYAYEIVQNCLPGDTLISTINGIVRLDSLVDIQGLKVWNGDRNVPARAIKTGKKRVHEIHLDNGQIMRASEDHKFLTVLNGRTAWTKVSALCPGDAICRAKPFILPQLVESDHADIREVKGRQISLPNRINSQIAILLGVFTGDGYVADERQWSLSGHTDDRDVIDTCNDLLRKIFGISFSKIRKHNNTLVASLACREFARHAYSVYGLTKGVAHQKEIPHSVLRSYPDVWRAFLRGLFDADGHIDPKAGHVMLTSVSPQLAHQSVILLQSLGINCAVFPIAISRLGRHQPYRIIIPNAGLRQFSDQIGFIGRRKRRLLQAALCLPRRRKWVSARNHAVATVIEVKATRRSEDMYDLITRSKEHMFWANGLLAHNCDVAISMHRDKDLKLSNRMLWSIMEHREGEEFSWLTHWDLDTMNFDFIQEVQLEDLIEDQKKGKASTFKF